MQRSVLFIVLLFSGFNSFSQPFDCSRFKEGKFRTADPRVGSIVATDRRGSYQTESTESLKLILRFNISWQDNCNYTLRLDKVIRNENKVEVPSNLQLKVKIVETLPNSYIEEIWTSMTNGTYRAEAVKE